MLARGFGGPAPTSCSGGLVLYFVLHAAFSLMSIAGLRGAVPVNLILPVIVPPSAETSDDAAAAAGCGAGGAACTALRSPLLHTVSRNIPPTTLKILPFIASSGMLSSAARAKRPAYRARASAPSRSRAR